MKQYVMSLDGGGSKLLCLLADGNGNLVGKGRGGPTNLTYCEPGTVEESVRTGILQALEQSKMQRCEISAVYSAILAYDGEWMSQVFKKLLGCSPDIHSCGEFALSLFGAIQEEAGALVQSGTGSFAAVGTGKSFHTVGGKGAVAGDEGSGYYIGRKALVACLRMEDGLGPATMLKDRLADFMQERLDSILWKLNHLPPDRQRTAIASFCPVVGDCAKEGDAAAAGILRKSAWHLANLLLAVLKKAGIRGELPISVSGGAWKTSPLLFRSFVGYIREELPDARILPPLFEPAAGGILLGLRDSGFPVRERMEELKVKLAEFAYPAQLFRQTETL